MKNNKGFTLIELLMKNNKGFTLIELMIAIAIVVILSSFVMVSVIKSRNDAADSEISLNLANAKAQSGLYYDSNADSYGLFTSESTSGPCPATGNTTISSVSVFYDAKMMKSITDAALASKGVISGSDASIVISKSSCISNPYSWAAAVVLKSDATKAWCVDNSGNSKKEAITEGVPNKSFKIVSDILSCK